MRELKLTIDDIAVDPERYQRRRGHFADQTVEAIVEEGFRPEKFDPIPVCQDGGNRWVCAGDGHSRLEALRRLRDAGREVPEFVPVRRIRPEAAAKLADTANASRTPFSAVEEARIIARRREAGESWEEIGRDMHKSAATAKNVSVIASLSDYVQGFVGLPYGLTVNQAMSFARAATRFGWDAGVQQQIWLSLKDADLSDRVFSIAMEAIGRKVAATPPARDGMLFEVPPSVRAAVCELNALHKKIVKARTALRGLRRYTDVFHDRDLVAALGEPVDRELADLERRLENEALSLGDRRPTSAATFARTISRSLTKGAA